MLRIQLAPDGKRWEVIDTTTLQLYGCYYNKPDAQRRLQQLKD